jgi:hypothetical protein
MLMHSGQFYAGIIEVRFSDIIMMINTWDAYQYSMDSVEHFSVSLGMPVYTWHCYVLCIES